MPKEEKSNRIITIGLVIVICIAIVVLIYVNLPKEEKQEEQDSKLKGYVNIIYGEQNYNYSMSNLIKLDSFNGTGSFIKLGWLPDIVIDGPFNYTGVKITSLLNKIENLPESYNITVKASDDKTKNYNFTYSEIIGDVNVYNNSGNITGTGGVTMVLAYMQDGEYITDTKEGPLRIAFLDNGSITSSRLWTKMVISIEVIED
jgi:hypothetical protein